MAAAVTHKKERLPITSVTAPVLLVLFSYRQRFATPSPLRNSKLSLVQHESQTHIIRRAAEESGC